MAAPPITMFWRRPPFEPISIDENVKARCVSASSPQNSSAATPIGSCRAHYPMTSHRSVASTPPKQSASPDINPARRHGRRAVRLNQGVEVRS